MRPHVEINDDDTEDHHADQRLMGILHDQVLIRAYKVSDESKDSHPDACARKRITSELKMVHASESGRKRDEMSHHRQ